MSGAKCIEPIAKQLKAQQLAVDLSASTLHEN